MHSRGDCQDARRVRRRVEIRGFGGFSATLRAPRKGRNPKTGESVQVPAKYVPHFRPGKELRERIDTPADRPPKPVLAKRGCRRASPAPPTGPDIEHQALNSRHKAAQRKMATNPIEWDFRKLTGVLFVYVQTHAAHSPRATNAFRPSAPRSIDAGPKPSAVVRGRTRGFDGTRPQHDLSAALPISNNGDSPRKAVKRMRPATPAFSWDKV